ncbi:hypothetical protein AGMMS49982_14000 [Bacteroidia bacterium]|nr:hypothetical protein AGMMS49982_14000 [Bacteroidia bacterium]
MDKFDNDNFTEYFKDKNVFETANIADYYCQTGEELKPTTVNWRIYSLVQKGILQRIGKGKFAFGIEKPFIPEVPDKLKSVYAKIHREFPFIKMCAWHTAVLNEFMQHQQGKFYHLIEVDKDSADAVFYFLKEAKFSVFLNPNRDILDKYTPENKDVFIVKPLVSEAPIQEINGVFSISIEKMLVDIFCDDVLFAAQQGAEMRTIFHEALSKYTVNQNKMLRYANRRKRKESFNNYLKTITNFRQQY